jgi:hypothetical protein
VVEALERHPTPPIYRGTRVRRRRRLHSDRSHRGDQRMILQLSHSDQSNCSTGIV